MFWSNDLIKRPVFALLLWITGAAGVSARTFDDGSLGPPPAAARRIERTEDLVLGPKAEGRLGDYLLTNGLVAAVVEDLRYSSNIYQMGGLLTDFGRRLPNGRMGNSRMDEMVPIVYPKDRVYTNLRVFVAKSIKIAADGSDGGPAILRVEGEDGVLPYIAEVMKTKPGPVKVAWTIDYVLRPGASTLEIIQTIKNPGPGTKNLQFGFIYFLGDGLKFFVPGQGYGPQALKAGYNKFVGLEGPEVSYGLHYPDNPIKVLIDGGAIKGGSGEAVAMPPGAEKVIKTEVSIGLGDIASAYQGFFAGSMGRPVHGKVRFSPQTELAGFAEVMVFAKGASLPVTVARTAVDGGFTLWLPEGEWELAATGPWRPLGKRTPLTVTPSGVLTQPLLEPPATGQVDFRVRKKGGGLIPATLTFEPQGAINSNSVYLGKKEEPGAFERIVFSVSGQGTALLPPGRYKAHVSHGLEYEYVTREIDLQAGKPVTLAVDLEHSMDIKGYLTSDFHLHAQGSTDVDDSVQDKVSALAAGGVEFPVATDHDHIADYAPFIKALGAGKVMSSVVGVELTTVRWGHFNAFPVKRDPAKPNKGAIDWYNKTVPQVVREMRDQLGAEVVQMNHPRSKPGFVGGQGYLNNIGYSAKTGTATFKNQFTTDFEAIEIMDGLKATQLHQAREDWFSFLNQGLKWTVTGNSDSHNAFHLQAGYPVNLVRMPTDDPSKAKVADLVAAVKKHQVTVNGGLAIFPEVNGVKDTLGATFHEQSGKYRLKVKVLGPGWTDLKTLELFENGQVIKTWKFDKNGRVTKGEVNLELTPKRDAWYALFAFGEKDLYPVFPGATSLGYSNAFWIDVDGDGRYGPVMQVKQ